LVALRTLPSARAAPNFARSSTLVFSPAADDMSAGYPKFLSGLVVQSAIYSCILTCSCVASRRTLRFVTELPESPMLENELSAPAYEQTSDWTTAKMRGLSDEQLMHLIGSGLQDALSLLFDRYCRLVLGVALRILHDIGEAEDVTQEVFFEVYRRIHLYKPEKGSPKVWIMQCAYNRSLNRRQYLNLRNFYDQLPISEIAARGCVVEHNTLEDLSVRELRQALTRGLRELTKEQRITIELALFEGLLLSEIAERLGVTRGNVRHYYYRGLSKLKDYLNRQMHGKPEHGSEG
jgi:RNA polymerase sigma-70 factor (ECF subfamily)